MKATKQPTMTRQKAEEHWRFIEKLFRIDDEDGLISIEVAGYLYVEAMLHGAKHEREG